MLIAAGCSQPPPQTAEEIVNRSVEAHGGSALTDWNTMIIQGETTFPDIGRMFRAEYLLFAEKPGKVRVEKDLTKFEHGRLFYTYIYNNGTGWMQRNLKPAYSNEFHSQHERLFNQCEGIAYYANNAQLRLKSEAEADTVGVYVIEAVVDNDTTQLYIDPDSFYLVQEKFSYSTRGRSVAKTRKFSEFKKFGNIILPVKTVEIFSGEPPTIFTTTYNSVEFDQPIEAWMFEEDMPKTAEKK